MKRTRPYMIRSFASALFACVLACACSGKQQGKSGPNDTTVTNKPEDASTERGVAFKTSCQAATQKQFDRGLFLLHNMMYVQAREAFTAAEAA